MLAGIVHAQDAVISIPAAIDNESAGYAISSGTIDRIGNSEIVIDDNLYWFSGALEVYSDTGQSISFNDLQEGISVGFQITQEREMVSVWIIK
jgi:hypothetical protein